MYMDECGWKEAERRLFPGERDREDSRKDRRRYSVSEDIVTLAVSQSAGRKYVTDDMEYQVILNQADTKEQKKWQWNLRKRS